MIGAVKGGDTVLDENVLNVESARFHPESLRNVTANVVHQNRLPIGSSNMIPIDSQNF